MSEQATYTFIIPPSLWMTSNKRPARPLAANAIAQQLKGLAYYKGRCWPRAEFRGPVKLVAYIHLRETRRFDPMNAEPMVKPLIDGLVQAGVLVDDDSKHVVDPEFRHGAQDRTLRRREHKIVIEITSLEVSQ